MELPLDLQVPESPFIGPNHARGPEFECQLVVGINVRRLGAFVSEFEAAVALFDHAQKLWNGRDANPPFRWMRIAARDGALSLYHYLQALLAVKKFASLSPEWREVLNLKPLRQCEREFKTRFPRIEAVRHSISHSAELTRSPDKWREHSVAIGESGWKFSGGNIDQDTRIYSATYKPQASQTACEVSYDLTEGALRFLIDNVRKVFGVFASLDSKGIAERLRGETE